MKTNPPVIIRNAHILTMEGPPVECGSIAAENGRISFVSKDPEAAFASAGAIEIDAGGRLVTPGLIDPHTHIGIDEEGIGWEGDDYNETSDAATPHMRALDGINPFDRGFLDAAEAGVTTIQVLPGSANVIGGLMCTLKVLPGALLHEMVIRDPSGLKMAMGENPKKYHGAASGRAAKTRMGIAGLIREQLVKAQNYLEERSNGSLPGQRDLRMEALALALTRQIPVRFHAHRADDIATAIRIGQEFGLDVTIEHVTEGHLMPDYLASCGVDCAVGPTLSSRSKVELRELSWETYSALYKAGIPISMTTDHPVLPITYLVTSASMAVQAGLPAHAAWQALTLNAARHLRLEDRIGSLRPGKDADLVIWDRDPIENNGKPYITVADGRLTFDARSYG